MSTGSQAECPLCMDPLELDDISFFPCTCGYQICRFCWHRIRTDENGLCPACRRSYTEDPAEFKPLAETDLQRLKKEKRQKDSQKKQKAAENRKHLSNVRVVQKNLVFVVGLTQRLAEVDTLKKHEYFGRFGKIHKIVINQSTSYAGVQGPSASAYVTYYRSEDAIRAIQVVNNVTVDGRTIKASLGTTKYCSYFLRGLSCLKPDCMYLHEPGDELASFTKDQMQQGKHLEYEQLLYDEFNQNAKGNPTTTPPVVPPTTCAPTPSVHTGVVKNQNTKSSASSQKKTASSVRHQISRHSGGTKSTEGGGGRPFSTINGLQSRSAHRANSTSATEKLAFDVQPSTIGNNSCSAKQRASQQSRLPSDSKNGANPLPSDRRSVPAMSLAIGDRGITSSLSQDGPTTVVARTSQSQAVTSFSTDCDEIDGKSRLPRNDNSASYQSGKGNDEPLEGQISTHSLIDDPVQQNSFGNLSHKTDSHEDDLGFDPWNESTKGLADMMEKENEFSDRVIRPDPFMQANYLNNCRINPMDGYYNGCHHGIMAGNKTLGVKQLPISNRNGTSGCQLNFVPPSNSTTHSTDYQDWHNSLRHVLTKSNANCEAMPQTGGHMIATNHTAQQQQQHQHSTAQQLYMNYSDLEKAAEASRQWIASLQQFSDGFTGIQNGFRPDYGSYGRMSSSNMRPTSQLPPPGLYSRASIPPRMESQSTLADALD